jgi:hypothetical protein
MFEDVNICNWISKLNYLLKSVQIRKMNYVKYDLRKSEPNCNFTVWINSYLENLKLKQRVDEYMQEIGVRLEMSGLFKIETLEIFMDNREIEL